MFIFIVLYSGRFASVTTRSTRRLAKRSTPFGYLEEVSMTMILQMRSLKPVESLPKSKFYSFSINSSWEYWTIIYFKLNQLNRYKLGEDAVHAGLPLIDTRKTLIDRFCPAPARNKRQCIPRRFREIDGSCNNLENGHWGSAHTTFRRLLPPSYADGETIA